MKKKKTGTWKYPARKKRTAAKGLSKGAVQSRQDAVRDLASQLGLKEGDPDLVRIEARMKALQGCRDEAIADLDRMVEQGATDRDRALALCDRGMLRQRQGDFAGAIDDFGKAIELDPDSSVNLLTRRGMARSHIADFAGAISDFDRALAADPDCIDALECRGLVRATINDHAAALADLSRIAELRPDNYRCHEATGNVRMDQGRLRDAIAAFDRAIERNPEAVDSHFARAKAWRSLGEPQKAISSLAESARVCPNPLFLVLKAQIRVESEDEAGGLQDLDLALELDPDNILALLTRGSVRRGTGDIQGALEDIDRVLAIDPEEPQARMLLAEFRKDSH